MLPVNLTQHIEGLGKTGLGQSMLLDVRHWGAGHFHVHVFVIDPARQCPRRAKRGYTGRHSSGSFRWRDRFIKGSAYLSTRQIRAPSMPPVKAVSPPVIWPRP